MKRISSLLFALLVAFSAHSQTTPTSKTRSNDAFTQVDNYLTALKRLGIPTASSDVLSGTTTAQNSAKIIYNTTLNKLRIYNPVTLTWRDAIEVDLTNYYTKAEVDALLANIPTETPTLQQVLAQGNSAGNNITNLSSPTTGSDAVNKTYADSLGTGFGLSFNETTGKFDWGTTVDLGIATTHTVEVPKSSILGIGDPLNESSDVNILAYNTLGEIGLKGVAILIDGALSTGKGFRVTTPNGVDYESSINLGMDNSFYITSNFRVAPSGSDSDSGTIGEIRFPNDGYMYIRYPDTFTVKWGRILVDTNW